jgi:RimJ/RimL family protein N-acetyltransferase
MWGGGLPANAWGHGYATEGAKRCLEYGLNELGLREDLRNSAAVANVKSEGVMKKDRYEQSVRVHVHPLLADDVRLRECVVYEIGN